MQHMNPPDFWTQVRPWLAIAVAVGGLAWLVSVGKDIGVIETTVKQNGANAIAIGHRLDQHIDNSNRANEALAEILRTIENRTARLEGIEEERSR